MQLAKVSIIIPVYKVEKYLDKCLESVVNQTYKNLEIILVDDGSTDNCPAMCDEWAKRDGRIKVIHKKNGGVSSARNAGLDIMTGQYVTFVDADDWIDDDMIETMVNCCIENNYDISVCDFYFEYNDKNMIAEPSKSILYDDDEIITCYLLDKIRPEAGGKLFKSSLFNDEIRFNTEINYAEDLHLNYDVLKNTESVFVMGICKYHYLQNSGNSSTTPIMTDARALSWKHIVQIIEAEKDNRDNYEAAIWRFTVGIYAVLSRVLQVKEFRDKYYNEIVDTIKKYRRDILKNKYISKRHKLLTIMLAISRRFFAFAVINLRGKNESGS